MAKGGKVSASKKIKKAPKEEKSPNKKTPVQGQLQITLIKRLDTTKDSTNKDTTTTQQEQTTTQTTPSKSPIRRTKTIAQAIEDAKDIVKEVGKGRTRSASSKAKKAKKAAGAKKAATKKAAPKKSAAKKTEKKSEKNAPPKLGSASKKIKRTRTMAQTLADSKPLLKGLKKRR